MEDTPLIENLDWLCAPKAPVMIGEEFKFEGYNCVVTDTFDGCFAYNYVNPSYTTRQDKFISYNYWHLNAVKRTGRKTILKGGRQLPWQKPELVAERKLKRLKTKLLILAMSCD